MKEDLPGCTPNCTSNASFSSISLAATAEAKISTLSCRKFQAMLGSCYMFSVWTFARSVVMLTFAMMPKRDIGLRGSKLDKWLVQGGPPMWNLHCSQIPLWVLPLSGSWPMWCFGYPSPADAPSSSIRNGLLGSKARGHHRCGSLRGCDSFADFVVAPWSVSINVSLAWTLGNQRHCFWWDSVQSEKPFCSWEIKADVVMPKDMKLWKDVTTVELFAHPGGKYIPPRWIHYSVERSLTSFPQMWIVILSLQISRVVFFPFFEDSYAEDQVVQPDYHG